MALSATTVWELQTGGSDTLNGGAFDPGQTAGMFTDGAATAANTSAPVFTSASYTFLAGDVGAWVYLSSGTTGATVAGGWYKITSVSGGAATLDGTIGQGVLKTSFTRTTVVGCANGAAPTVITWTIDYSQQAAAQFAYTDLASTGTGLTVSSAAKPFAKQQVGNSLVIASGTNFNAGRYVIASVAAGVATVVGPTNITTGAGASGVGGQGGALLSIGILGNVVLTSNMAYIKTGSYSISSASTGIAGGCFTAGFVNCVMEGYSSVRNDLGTPPVFTATGSISTFTIFTASSNDSRFTNIKVDGSNYTSSRGFSLARSEAYKLIAINCSNGGISNTSGANISCLATGCSTIVAILGLHNVFCEAYTNTFGGISGRSTRCLSYNNTGATSDGFLSTGQGMNFDQCIAYANGRDGFRASQGSGGFSCCAINCVAESNIGTGFSRGTNSHFSVFNCAVYGNATNFNLVAGHDVGSITGTGSFFTNAAAGDFSINSTAGAGVLLRATGLSALFPRGLTASAPDIGVAQHPEPTDAAIAAAVWAYANRTLT